MSTALVAVHQLGRRRARVSVGVEQLLEFLLSGGEGDIYSQLTVVLISRIDRKSVV